MAAPDELLSQLWAALRRSSQAPEFR